MLTEEKKNKYQIQREKAAADLAEIKNIIKLIDEKDRQIKTKCDFLQTLVDCLPTPIYVKDLDLRYKVCNDALSILMGVNKENIIGKTLGEIYSDNEESKFIYEKDMELLENCGTQTFDHEIIGRNKYPQILSFSRSIFRDENRKVAGIIGSCFDITDRVKKEKELKVEREKFYNAFDQSPIPKTITQYGTGLILEINEAALEMFGFTRDEIKNKTVYELKTNSGIPLIKDHTNFNLKFFLNELDKTGRIKSMDIIIYTKNGNEKIIALSASKYRVNGGFCVLSILKDITDRKETENKLKEISEQYEAAIELSNDAVAIFQDGKHIFVNKTFLEIFGFSSFDEIIGQGYINIYSSDINFVKDLNRRRVEGLRVPKRYEFRGIRKDNNISICIEASAALINFKGKKATLTYLRDVTNRKKYEQFQNLPISTLDNIPEMVCRHDSNFKFTYANETYCKFIGKTREELETMTLFDFVPPDEIVRLEEYLKTFSINRTTSSIVNKVILHTDEIVYISWMNKAFFNSETGKLIELQSIGKVSGIFDLEAKPE